MTCNSIKEMVINHEEQYQKNLFVQIICAKCYQCKCNADLMIKKLHNASLFCTCGKMNERLLPRARYRGPSNDVLCMKTVCVYLLAPQYTLTHK